MLGLALSPVAGSFSPFSVLGLKPALWLDSSRGLFSDGAASLDRTLNQHLARTAGPGLPSAAGSFTFCAWARITYVGNYHFLMSREASGGARVSSLFVDVDSGNKFAFAVSTQNGSFLVSQQVPTANTWYFVCATHDAAAKIISISVNDQAPVVASYTGELPTTAVPLALGWSEYWGSYSWNGDMDSAAWFNEVLSSERRASLYNGGKGRTYGDLSAAQKTGLVSWWDLNEASGTRYDSHGTNHLAEVGGTIASAGGVAVGAAGLGDPVALWEDRSGNGRHARQSVFAQRPIVGSGVIGDGDDDEMGIGTFQISEYYAVFRSLGPTFNTYGSVIEAHTEADRLGLFESGTTRYFNGPAPRAVRRNGVELAAPFDLAPITAPMLVAVRTANPELTREMFLFRLQHIWSANIEIREILAFSTDLSAGDQSKVERYLAKKHGITLP